MLPPSASALRHERRRSPHKKHATGNPRALHQWRLLEEKSSKHSFPDGSEHAGPVVLLRRRNVTSENNECAPLIFAYTTCASVELQDVTRPTLHAHITI